MTVAKLFDGYRQKLVEVKGDKRKDPALSRLLGDEFTVEVAGITKSLHGIGSGLRLPCFSHG